MAVRIRNESVLMCEGQVEPIAGADTDAVEGRTGRHRQARRVGGSISLLRRLITAFV